MIFDIILVGISGFIAYCCYIAVIVPYQEKKRKAFARTMEWLDSIQKEKSN